MNLSSTTRFSKRSNDYQKYRPSYPEAVVTYLEQTIGLNKDSKIADIGSGTGIFSALLLKHGYALKGIEPNEDMRLHAENRLSHYDYFESVDGTAEETGLDNQSIDLITAAQSFHWFDIPRVKEEFYRIAKPGAHVLLIWNILQDRTDFLKEYQALKAKYAPDVVHPHRANLENIQDFFKPHELTIQNLYHSQNLDKTSLKGYLLSFSTVPLFDHPDYDSMIEELEILFDQHEHNGQVKMEYETRLYLAQIS
ncbi:class I SAM-dependent methyltransferase [Pedobacter punctiformis]|uniref:Class I SAM-dependent methyltransferase n=1 Tax=Pedobacter punctiformis TaxID=3004097 RepID=A0ABT4L6L5_9SPHI|nr:class I SAM-dependent methyltransferase [Pedobacter sp. HCMS5-2]MCZ4243553.1 class I SAM-dependent methyltransferase [Pedobacter sp. HCMS5-2]